MLHICWKIQTFPTKGLYLTGVVKKNVVLTEASGVRPQAYTVKPRYNEVGKIGNLLCYTEASLNKNLSFY